MKKLIILLIILTISIIMLTGEEIPIFMDKKHYYHSDRSSIIISKDYTNFYWDIDYSEEVTSKKFSSVILNKKYFKVLDTSEEDYLLFDCSVDGVSFLSLVDSRYDKKKYYEKIEIPYHLSLVNKFKTSPYLKGVSIINVSTYLREKINDEDVKYLPERWDLSGIPWAIKNDEKVKKIVFTVVADNWDRNDDYSLLPVSSLVLVNGLIVPDKEYLYEENCRAKNIRISYGNISKVYTLEDKANFQILELPTSVKPVPPNEITLEIIDWYQKTKYNDIVITAVLFPNAKMK